MTVSSSTYQCDSCPNTQVIGSPGLTPDMPVGWGRITIFLQIAAGKLQSTSWDSCPTCYTKITQAAGGAVPNPPQNIPQEPPGV